MSYREEFRKGGSLLTTAFQILVYTVRKV